MSAYPSQRGSRTEDNSALSNLCKRSSSLIGNTSAIVEKLKNGSDVNVTSNSSTVLMLADTIKSVLSDSKDYPSLSRDEVLSCLKAFPCIFTLPIQIYFIAGCKAMRMSQSMDTVPDEEQIMKLIPDIICLNHSGLTTNIWMYLEQFIEETIMKLTMTLPTSYKLDLCHFLQIIGSTAKSGSIIIARLEMIFHSFHVYMQDMDWKVLADEEAEALILILNTIIEILEYNSGPRAMEGMLDFKKLSVTLQRFKKLTNLRLFHADISYCLGLLPV